MEESPQTTDSGSTPYPNHQQGAFKRWEEKESRTDQEQAIHSLLADVANLKKQIDDLEKEKVMEKLDLPPELAESIGIKPKVPRRIKRGMGVRPLLESEINEAYEHGVTAAGAARWLGVHYTTLKKHATRLGVWRTERHAKGVIKRPWNPEKGKYPLSEILDCKHPNYPLNKIRDKLFKGGVKERKCENCGFKETRITDDQSPLVIDFYDGNRHNHKLDNMRILCYNCVFLVGRGSLNAKWDS